MQISKNSPPLDPYGADGAHWETINILTNLSKALVNPHKKTSLEKSLNYIISKKKRIRSWDKKFIHLVFVLV
jgi:hypothetical protein